MLCKRTIKQQQNLYLIFIDYNENGVQTNNLRYADVTVLVNTNGKALKEQLTQQQPRMISVAVFFV